MYTDEQLIDIARAYQKKTGQPIVHMLRNRVVPGKVTIDLTQTPPKITHLEDPMKGKYEGVLFDKEPVATNQHGWLILRKQAPQTSQRLYLMGFDGGGISLNNGCWTFNATDAMTFYRKADALAMIRAAGFDGASAVPLEGEQRK